MCSHSVRSVAIALHRHPPYLHLRQELTLNRVFIYRPPFFPSSEPDRSRPLPPAGGRWGPAGIRATVKPSTTQPPPAGRTRVRERDFIAKKKKKELVFIRNRQKWSHEKKRFGELRRRHTLTRSRIEPEYPVEYPTKLTRLDPGLSARRAAA